MALQLLLIFLVSRFFVKFGECCWEIESKTIVIVNLIQGNIWKNNLTWNQGFLAGSGPFSDVKKSEITWIPVSTWRSRMIWHPILSHFQSFDFLRQIGTTIFLKISRQGIFARISQMEPFSPFFHYLYKKFCLDK